MPREFNYIRELMLVKGDSLEFWTEDARGAELRS